MNIENATAKIDPRVEEAKKLLEDVGFVVSPVQGGDPMARLTRAVEELQEKVFSGHTVDYVQKSNGGGKIVPIGNICHQLCEAIFETQRLADCVTARTASLVGYRNDPPSNVEVQHESPQAMFSIADQLQEMYARITLANNQLHSEVLRLEEGI